MGWRHRVHENIQRRAQSRHTEQQRIQQRIHQKRCAEERRHMDGVVLHRRNANRLKLHYFRAELGDWCIANDLILQKIEKKVWEICGKYTLGTGDKL